MKKLFWFIVGICVTIFAITKGRELLHKLTPAGISEQITDKSKDAMGRMQEFYADFTAARADRESELRAELNMKPKH